MAIFLGGNKKPEWPKNTSPTTGSPAMFPYYGMRHQASDIVYLPGFSDDAAAGSTIKLTTVSNGEGISRLDYYNAAGTAFTTNAWASGLTAADVTGAEHIVGMYMDDNDECMYFLAMNTGTSPDQYKLCSVDKEGVVTQSFAWTDPSGTSFDYDSSMYNYKGALHRTGGDGSGNFVFTNTQAQIGVDGLAAPYIGAKMTFASSDGALTEAALVPTTAGGPAAFNSASMGPTSNNIYAGYPYCQETYSNNPVFGYGSIFNTSTGKGFHRCAHTYSAFTPWGFAYAPGVQQFRWRSLYCFFVARGGNYGAMWYAEDDIHNYIDELAVQYGIL